MKKQYVIYNLQTKRWVKRFNDTRCLHYSTYSDRIDETKEVGYAEKFNTLEDAEQYLTENYKFLFTSEWEPEMYFDIRPIYAVSLSKEE